VERGAITIACNFSSSPQKVPLRLGAPHRIRLASKRDASLSKSGVELPPDSVVVLEQ
jgi:hypothetical protein